MKRYGLIQFWRGSLIAAILCAFLFSAHTVMAVSLTYQLKGAQDFPSNPANAYFMMGIPLFILPSSDTFLVLKDNFGGSYNPALWRLFSLNSSTNVYKEITAQGQDYIGFGKGWWIIASKATNFTLSGAATTSDFSVQVYPGWNMIANPYADKTLSWTQIAASTANLGLSLASTLYQFQSTGEYVKVTTMNVGAAYWCYVGATQGGNLTITYPVNALSLGAESIQHEFFTEQDSPPPPPLPPGASLKILLPKEGDQFRYGDMLSIEWESTGISPEGFQNEVRISVSPDNGDHFFVIANQVENTGFFQTRIPVRYRSTNLIVKVGSVLYPEMFAYSSPISIVK